MHSAPRWDRGSRRRVSRIHFRGNWPDRWLIVVMLLVLLGSSLILAAHAWRQLAELGLNR